MWRIAAALDGVVRQAHSDMQRDGELYDPPDWVKEITAGTGARFYAGAGWLRAYKANLRALLAKPRLRLVQTEPDEKGGAR